MKNPIGMVDLDGVLAQYDGWKGHLHIGEPFPEAKAFMRELRSYCPVWIYTTRCSADAHKDPVELAESIKTVEDWLAKHQIPYDGIYLGMGKPLCAFFIDDRAISLRPMEVNDSLKMTSGGGVWDYQMQCDVLGIEYDFRKRCGRLLMAQNQNCDMKGCIERFTLIDKNVEKIITFAGLYPDTIYAKSGGEWEAFMETEISVESLARSGLYIKSIEQAKHLVGDAK